MNTSTILHEADFHTDHINAQLAHQKQRVKLMNWWGNYVDNCTRDKSISLPRRTAGNRFVP